MSWLTKEDMFLTLCKWSKSDWDKEKHCPQKINVFTRDTVYVLDAANHNLRTLEAVPDTAEDIRRIAAERYGKKIEGRITHVEFVRIPNRVRFAIKEELM